MTSKTIQDAKKMQEAMKLKFTYRFGDRLQWPWESVASHSWSMFLVCDYLLEILDSLAPWKYKLDEKLIYDLIIYHDLIEAETGDESLGLKNSKNHAAKWDKEKLAMETFPYKLPKQLQQKFIEMYHHYEEKKSLESKFVKIVDIIEAEYFCHNKEYLFEWWTKQYHQSIRLKHFKDFPELEYIIHEIIDHANSNYYSK